MDDPIVIKGIREGLLLTIKPDGSEWSELMARLSVRLDEKRSFFKGARVALDVSDRPLRQHELEHVRLVLVKRDMTLWAVVSNSFTTQAAARHLGLETELIAQQEQLDTPETNPEETGSAAVLIDHTLRNGRTVRYPGHVVVYGDVNAGAEIVAKGNVIVWGRLRGKVHAGAEGDETAVVCALDLVPTQLRIAGYITVSPEDRRRKPRPEIAAVRNGHIVAEAWSG